MGEQSPFDVDAAWQTLTARVGVQWTAEWGRFCRRYWAQLGASPPPSQSHSDRFLETLLHQENLDIAELVVPDLRAHAPLPQDPSAQKLYILQRVKDFRSPQTEHDSSVQAMLHLFQEEEAIMFDADLHRLQLLADKAGVGVDVEKLTGLLREIRSGDGVGVEGEGGGGRSRKDAAPS